MSKNNIFTQEYLKQACDQKIKTILAKCNENPRMLQSFNSDAFKYFVARAQAIYEKDRKDYSIDRKKLSIHINQYNDLLHLKQTIEGVIDLQNKKKKAIEVQKKALNEYESLMAFLGFKCEKDIEEVEDIIEPQLSSKNFSIPAIFNRNCNAINPWREILVGRMQ